MTSTMELDDTPAPTSRLDHLAELATSPTHANVHPSNSSTTIASTLATSSSSSSRTTTTTTTTSQYTHQSQEDTSSSRHHSHHHSQSHDGQTDLATTRPHHASSTSSPSSYPKNDQSSSSSSSTSPVPHHQSRPQVIQQQLEVESGSSWGRSPITPTTTRKFNRMAIHEVLEGQNSPPYKRKGSPEESMFSDQSRTRTSTTRGGSFSSSNHHHHHHHAHLADHQPRSPRHHRQESPMPQSNSEEDEDSDIRNYKKRRMLKSTTSSSSSSSSINKQSSPPSSSSGSSNGPEVMDQVRTTLKLKQQQKAIIEARQSGAQTPTTSTSAQGASTTLSSFQGSKSKEGINGASGGSSQPVTEKNQSGISVFHGSASFAALNKRPLTSPNKIKNAKSLTIFAPSYSESSLSIHSAPLQPSQGHQGMGMNPRTSQPLRNQTAQHLLQPHPLSQHPHQPSQPLSSIPQPLRSPKTAGHAKKSSRAALRPGPHTAGLDNSSGTLPAPILSSHTGPLPSPAMYPHPSTPFHPSNHHSSLSNGPSNHHHVSKPVFMETVSNLFDSMDSTRSLKHTLEEQIRKSAQLLQTLQSSGTMIESLVRGQFKELEKGVIERFENELEHLSARVGQLEEHQGLTPPPKKARGPITAAAASTSSSAMTGVVSTSMPSPPSASSSGAATNGVSEAARHGSESELKDGTLPTPPFNKNQDSAMEVEDEEPVASTATSASASPPLAPARDQPAEYNSKVKKLQERVASLEKRQQEATTEA